MSEEKNREVEELEALVEENRNAFLRAKRLLAAMKRHNTRGDDITESQAAPRIEIPARAANPNAPEPRLSSGWLDLESLARVELGAREKPDELKASALAKDSATPWWPHDPGHQTIRLSFDVPQNIKRIRVVFEEGEQERTQEFALRWRAQGSDAFREILRQQYVFSPHGSTREVEEYQVDLRELICIELSILPDLNGRMAFASLSHLGLAAEGAEPKSRE